MFQKLVSRNNDLGRLVERGYAIAFDSGYMVVRDIPYLDHDKQLRWGAIVTKLEFVDQEVVKQTDHQIFFAGSHPHNSDGAAIANLGGGHCQLQLSEHCADVVVQRSFSNKPRDRSFVDFFEKIESYVTIVCGPAMLLHGANPYTFRTQKVMSESVFKFQDTLTSRAEIGDLAKNFKNDVIAIIGLGGTGAYLLDFLAKTPVKEIRAFDLDSFHVHNAFRSPGKLETNELGMKKSDVYLGRYDSFRHGLTCAPKAIDSSSAGDVDGVTFAFVCVDKGSARSEIFDLLLSKKIPFIDVGMGLNRKHGSLNGMMRATYYSAENGEAVRAKGFAEMSDGPENVYKTNIQIAELNAMNACLAVIKFKQIRGYYHAASEAFHFLFEISDLSSVSESEI